MAYKVFESTWHGTPKLCYHSLRGCRGLTPEVWHKAEVKSVRDGSGKDNYYQSGFHVFKTRADAEKWFASLRNKAERAICKVSARGMKPKPKSRTNIYLADAIRVSWEDWFHARKRATAEFFGK